MEAVLAHCYGMGEAVFNNIHQTTAQFFHKFVFIILTAEELFLK